MNAVKKIEDIKISEEQLEQVHERVRQAWFCQTASPDFQNYLKNIKPSFVAENNTLQKSMLSTEFLVLIVDGAIEKKNTPFENHADFILKPGDTFYFSSFEYQEYRAQTDTIIFEIPLDRSMTAVASLSPDLDMLRAVKLRPNLLPVFRKYPQTEMVKRICKQELDKSVKLIDVEKGKKLFLEDSSIYLIDHGSIFSSVSEQHKKASELILDLDERFDPQMALSFVAVTNSKICEYKVNDTAVTDVLLQNAEKQSQSTKSGLNSEGVTTFNFEYLKSKHSNLNLNALKNLHPFNKLVITSSRKEYLKVSIGNIATALDSTMALKISQDQLLLAENSAQIEIQYLANLLEIRGFFTRKRRIAANNFNIQSKIYLWVYNNKICLILNNLNHANAEEVIAFESTAGFFVMSKLQMTKSPYLLEIEKNQFEKFQIENTKTTFDKADYYGLKFLNKSFSKRIILSKNLFTFKLFQTVLVLLVPTLIYKYLNIAITTKNSQVVYTMSLTLLLFLGFQTTALFLYNYYYQEFTTSYKSAVSGFFHKILLSQKMNSLKVGYVQTRLSLSEFAFSALKYQKLELPIYGAMLTFYLFYIGTYSLDASVALLVVFGLAAGVVYGLRKKGNFSELNSVQLKQDLMDYYLEVVKSLPHVNLLKQNHTMLNRINNQTKMALVSSNEYTLGLGFISILGNGLFKCGTLLVLYLVVIEMIRNKLGATQLFGVSLFLSYLTSPFQAFSNFMTNMNTTGLMNIPMQFLRMESQDQNKKTESFSFNESITFNKVHFLYFEKNPFSLMDINFKIRKNMMTAFIGRTNSGKSTVAKLVTHTLDHQHGSLQIDEKESNLFDKQLLMNELSYCPQVPELFGGTILSNLLPQSQL